MMAMTNSTMLGGPIQPRLGGSHFGLKVIIFSTEHDFSVPWRVQLRHGSLGEERGTMGNPRLMEEKHPVKT